MELKLVDTPQDKLKRAQLVKELSFLGVTNKKVLEAIQAVPRHFFVPFHLQTLAYENCALPIGQGQTISQPFVVARMTQILWDAQHPTKVLEVGTGSGYQAAILAYLYQRVYTLERINRLLEDTKKVFDLLEFKNITFIYGDGYLGYSPASPYDAILATAVASEAPKALLDQLSPEEGHLVIPLNDQNGNQFITLVIKKHAAIQALKKEPVRFVSMRGGTQ